MSAIGDWLQAARKKCACSGMASRGRIEIASAPRRSRRGNEHDRFRMVLAPQIARAGIPLCRAAANSPIFELAHMKRIRSGGAARLRRNMLCSASKPAERRPAAGPAALRLSISSPALQMLDHFEGDDQIERAIGKRERFAGALQEMNARASKIRARAWSTASAEISTPTTREAAPNSARSVTGSASGIEHTCAPRFAQNAPRTGSAPDARSTDRHPPAPGPRVRR